MLQISFSGVSYQRGETPQSLRMAIQLLHERLLELEADMAGSNGRHVSDIRASSLTRASGPASPAEAPSANGSVGVTVQKSGEGAASDAKKDGGVSGGGRWFADRWTKVTLRSGEVVIPRTVDELKGLVEKQGLRPHKRGDASMLLWQVKERLGLNVESVGRPSD